MADAPIVAWFLGFVHRRNARCRHQRKCEKGEQMKSTMQRATTLAMAAGIAAVGLIMGGVALAWVAGSLGISTAAASQIVNAVEVGGLALTLVGAAFGFGVGSALVATIRWYILRKGKAVAIA